jgi:hypothetical protein
MEDQPVLIEEELPQPTASSGADGEKKRQTTRHEDPKKRTTSLSPAQEYTSLVRSQTSRCLVSYASC